MRKRLIALLLASVMVFAMIPHALAASEAATTAADGLNKLGLFSGVGTNEDGTPNYDLDRAPTRQEAITMLVKLVGGAEEASKGGWVTPFTDVDAWAENWVGYAYAKGLTAGTSATTFGANDMTTAAQYLTFILKALGYDANSDFSWDKAWELSNKIGLTDGEYDANSDFTRGDVAIISYQALSTKVKGQDMTLADSLGLIVDKEAVETPAPEVADPEEEPDAPTAPSAGAGAETPAVYTVNFAYNYYGMGSYKTVEVQAGGTVERPADPVRAGYIFDGWCLKEIGGAKFDFDTPINSDVTVYAIWKVKPSSTPRYAVTFDSNGGSAVEAQRVVRGRTAAQPEDPTKDNFSFAGWYSDPELTTAYDFAEPVTGAVTLYAKWDTGVTTYQVTFDSNGGSAVASQYVPNGGCVSVPETPEQDGFAFIGWYVDDAFSDRFDFLTIINGDCTVYARWVDIDDETDTDVDGLTDPMEEYYGTDKSKADTDGDGLTDFFEISASNINPLLVDTDENEIPDGDEDFDADGLTNLAEQANKCNPNSEDTDMDGLSDYAELNTHQTRPDVKDTDEDGLADGDEIALGLDPLQQMTDGETLDSERTFTQTLTNISESLQSSEAKPSLTMTTSGNIDATTTIVEAASETLEGNKAVVGDPIFVQTSTDMPEEGATLTFDIGSGARSRASGVGEASQYLICRYDETEDGTAFEPLETSYEGSTLSARVDGEGTYFVLNTETFLLNLGIDPMSYFEATPAMLMSVAAEREVVPHMTKEERRAADQKPAETPETVKLMTLRDTAEVPAAEPVAAEIETTKAQADIVFIIDTTGSMWDPIENVADNVNAFADSLVNDYNINANFSVIEFQDITHDGLDSTIQHKNGSSNWWNAKAVDSFKNEVNDLVPDDGGDWAETPIDGLAMARELVASSSAQKFFILITDAPYKESNQYGIENMAAMVELLVNDGINVSVITDDWSDWSDSEYEEDGKVSGYQTLYEETSGLYGYIYDRSFYTTLLQIAGMIDTDVNDGSWVVLEPYETIKLDEAPTADSTADTDKDGIKDIDELGSSTKRDVSRYVSTYLAARGLTLDEYLERGGKQFIDVYSFKSHPGEKDTDGDGLQDKEDPKPKYFNVTDRHLALFAKLSYSSKDIDENTSFNKNALGYATLDEVDGWMLVGSVVYENKKGEQVLFAANTYQNLSTKEVVVAFRGTDDEGVGSDWAGHFLSLAPWTAHPQAPDAESYIRNAIERFKTSNIYITGHSLGGYLAAYASGVIGDEDQFKKCVIFNGLGLDATGIKDIKNCLKRNSSKITNYRVEGDVVSAVGTHYGKEYAYIINYDVAVEYDLDEVFDIEWWEILKMAEAEKNFILASHDMRNFFTYPEMCTRY